jgi:hypothetical protein
VGVQRKPADKHVNTPVSGRRLAPIRATQSSWWLGVIGMPLATELGCRSGCVSTLQVVTGACFEAGFVTAVPVATVSGRMMGNAGVLDGVHDQAECPGVYGLAGAGIVPVACQVIERHEDAIRESRTRLTGRLGQQEAGLALGLKEPIQRSILIE